MEIEIDNKKISIRACKDLTKISLVQVDNVM